MKLTLGPHLFNWPADAWSDFYARIADEADVDRVVLGEVVCSKRLPFYAERIPEAIERLERGGKEVVLASLGLVTLPRERAQSKELASCAGRLIEANDLTLLRYLAEGQGFTIGPLVNVYNEGTLAFLARQGARSVCLPPELPMASIETLAQAGRSDDVEIEVWGFGRVPLAISGRCYHARVHALAKDSCLFVCEKDRDGLEVDTMDGIEFLAINGVQTMSHTYANAVLDIPRLREAGVAALRLSPHSCDMVAVASAFRACAQGRIAPAEALAELRALAPGARYANGFMTGKAGAEALPDDAALLPQG